VTGDPTAKVRKLTVLEAAEALGISEGAIRMRIKRGTLPSTREGGRVYILLEQEQTTEQDRT
jgi:excisionase family DNA binding protein